MTEEYEDLVSAMSAKQPTRSKRVVKERRFDQTQLREASHGQIVHRDYAAHFFRWGFIQRMVQAGERILDVGCGQDLPLMKILGRNLNTVPEAYVGVDLNRVRPTGVQWASVYDEFDFTSRWAELLEKHGPFTIATNFEVIEHMMPADGNRLLSGIYGCLKPGGRLYLSTPVFDGHAAANHIHEYTIAELQEHLEQERFKIVKRYGTFASKPAIQKVMTVEQRSVYDDLSEYYSGEVMSTFMAPLYPNASRNNLWVCEK